MKYLVPAVQRIPDKLERMQMAIEVAGYVGVDQANQGMVLDAFKKSVADRNERPMQQPAETLRPDEKGLVNVLLSDIEGRDVLLDELPKIEILQRLPSRRILQAMAAVHASGLPLAFDAVNGRLEESDQRLLAMAVLSADGEGHDFTLEYGIQCMDSLRRSDDLRQRQELKRRIKEAERTGNLAEALRLAQELQELERRGTAPLRVSLNKSGGCAVVYNDLDSSPTGSTGLQWRLKTNTTGCKSSYNWAKRRATSCTTR